MSLVRSPGKPLLIAEVAKSAEKFKRRLNSVKRTLADDQIAWYPYDSFSVFPVLRKLLAPGHDDLSAFLGSDPILDVGSGDGVLSFFFESLGYEVHAVDWPETNFNRMVGLAKLKSALRSSVHVHAINLDAGFALPPQHFGLSLAFGLLYHLKNPFGFLEALARRTRYCLLSTRVAQLTPDHSTRIERAPVAYLVDETETNQDRTNYWIFSEEGLRRVLARTGWDVSALLTTGCTVDSDPSDPGADERAFCLLRSRVNAGRSAVELLSGWHALENDAWRWTEREFAVRVSGLSGVVTRTLKFRFAIPAVVLEKLGPIRLEAEVNGVRLGAETFRAPGPHVYVKSCPPLVAAAEYRVKFTLDKFMPPDEQDQRERGLVVVFDGADMPWELL
jgi:tRNA (mo5U34)-methyltransferase